MFEKSLIEEYLSHCECTRKLDIKTIRAYRSDLVQFLEWSTMMPWSISRETVCDYLAYLNTRYASASVRRKVAALRAFVSWAAEEQRISENPFAELRLRIKGPKRLPRTIALSDLDLLFGSLYKDIEIPITFFLARDRAIFEVLIATGVRVSELCSFDVGSVDLEGKVVRIVGKGNKERTVQLENEHTIHALGDYLAIREEVAATDNKALFVNRLGARMSDRAVREMVDRRAIDAGLSAHITPHMFRHTFATLLLEGDVDICYIQKLLGHSSISTTEIYAHVTSAKLRSIMRDSNPRKAIRF